MNDSSGTEKTDHKAILERAAANLLSLKAGGDAAAIAAAELAMAEATEAALMDTFDDVEETPAEDSVDVVEEEVVEEVSFRDKNTALHARWTQAREEAESFRAAGEIRKADLAQERADLIANEVVSTNSGLATSVAKAFQTQGDDSWQDYKSAGLMGLWEAFTKWDPQNGATLGTFSRFYIKGAIQRTVRKVEFARMSQTDFNRRNEVMASAAKLARDLGRSASFAEISADTKLSVGLVERALSKRAESLDAPVGDGSMTVGDLYNDTDRGREADLSTEQLERLESLFGVLAADEAWVMAQRYGLAGGPPRSLVEVADDIGIGREIARRTEKRAIDKLAAAAKAK